MRRGIKYLLYTVPPRSSLLGFEEGVELGRPGFGIATTTFATCGPLTDYHFR